MQLLLRFEIRLIPVPTARGRLYGIIVDRRNRPWIAEFGTHNLAVVDPDAMTLEEISLQREAARPRRLAETTFIFTPRGAVATFGG